MASFGTTFLYQQCHQSIVRDRACRGGTCNCALGLPCVSKVQKVIVMRIERLVTAVVFGALLVFLFKGYECADTVVRVRACGVGSVVVRLLNLSLHGSCLASDIEGRCKMQQGRSGSGFVSHSSGGFMICPAACRDPAEGRVRCVSHQTPKHGHEDMGCPMLW